MPQIAAEYFPARGFPPLSPSSEKGSYLGTRKEKRYQESTAKGRA